MPKPVKKQDKPKLLELEDYPYVMGATHLARFLGVSRPMAYEVMHRLPRIKLGTGEKSNVRVFRDDVVSWLQSQKEAK